MLNLDAALVWSPRYRTVELPGGRWAFLGPSRDFLLSETQLGSLTPNAGGTIIPRALLPGGDFAMAAQRLWQLEGLVDAGLLVHADCLAPAPAPNMVRAWVERLDWPTPTKVFIAEIVLETDLLAFAQQRQADGESWVLVTPYADRPLVGPYFDARDVTRPCWACYRAQLRHNRPLRRWLRHHYGELPPSAPPFAKKGQIQKLFSHMRQYRGLLAKLIASPVVFALEGDGKRWVSHPVRKQASCRHCGALDCGALGVADGAVHPAERPVVLRAVPAHYLRDGGWRVQAPHLTLAGMRDWVSPLSGLFRDSRALGETPQGLSVHRASFGVCPLDRTAVESANFVDVALGKGVSPEQSAASALGEATERLAAHYRGDECIRVARAHELPAAAILPAQLAPFSERQYRAFEGDGRASPDAVQRYGAQDTLEWTPAWSIYRREVCYLPASYCYTHAPFVGTRYCRFTSNGGAAGSVVEEAILQGFFELIERDAVAIWWYNRLQRPQIKQSEWWRADAARVAATIGERWHWWALDLTHDFDLPVVAAVARHRHNGRAAFGFGCHLDPCLALRRALTELCQLIVAGVAYASAFDFDALVWDPYLLPGEGAPSSHFRAPQTPDTVDLREVILDGAARAQRLGLDMLVHDYGRPDFPLRTAKVIIAGLNHLWPRLGCRRLYEVPVTMGWLPRPKRVSELNSVPLWL